MSAIFPKKLLRMRIDGYDIVREIDGSLSQSLDIVYQDYTLDELAYILRQIFENEYHDAVVSKGDSHVEMRCGNSHLFISDHILPSPEELEEIMENF